MVNTGNKIITEQDMNPNSSTYGDTRETIVYDSVMCPPGIDFKAKYSTSQASNKYIYCNGETKMISSELPDNVTSIVFGNCVAETDEELFYYNNTLRSVTFSSSVETIGSGSFNYCTSLTSATFAEGLTLIKNHAFAGCQNLSGDIVLPDSLTTLRQYAFSSCSSVTSFTLGTGLTHLDDYVFYNCTGLTSVTMTATTPPTISGAHIFDNTNNCQILVPAQSLDTYKQRFQKYASRIQAIPS